MRSEHVERIPNRDDAYADLRSKTARWVADHFEKLKDAHPDDKELTDRGRDNWEPLLAIADAADGQWPALARSAARYLSRADDDETFAIVLLKDLAVMFDTDGDELSSTEIVEKLNAMEDRPWPEFKHGKPITTQGVARLPNPSRFSHASCGFLAARPTATPATDLNKPSQYICPRKGIYPHLPT